MDTRKTRDLPARLEQARQRFERWRQTRKIPSRIPGRLWALAARMAGRYGISHTAKTLRVNYNALKQRVDEGAATTGRSEKSAADQRHHATLTTASRRCLAPSVPAFLELAPPTRAGSCQCTLEFEDASGAKMRVHLQGTEAPDLTALSRSFWDRGP